MELDSRQVFSIAMLIGAMVLMLFWRKEAIALMRLFQAEIDNFAGRGPRPPMHPLPADDSRLLLRRSVRQSNTPL